MIILGVFMASSLSFAIDLKNSKLNAPAQFTSFTNIKKPLIRNEPNCQSEEKTIFCEVYDKCKNLAGVQNIIPFNMLESYGKCYTSYHETELMKTVDTNDVFKSHNELLGFDFYAPNDWYLKDYPIFVLIHGGGWSEGDKLETIFINKFLAERGFKVFSINYSLAKENQKETQFPRQIEDVSSFMSYLLSEENKKKFSIQNANINILGLSAGGHLALYEAINGYENNFQCTISIAGPTNLNTLLEDQNKVDFKNPEHKKDMNIFLTKLLDKAIPFGEDRYKYSLIENAEMLKSNKTYLIHNDKDYLVNYSQSLNFYNKLMGKKNIELITIKGSDFDDGGHNLSNKIINSNLEKIIQNCY